MASLATLVVPIALAASRVFVFDQEAYERLLLGLVQNHMILLVAPSLVAVTAVTITLTDVFIQKRSIAFHLFLVVLFNVGGTAYYWFRELQFMRER